MLHFSSATKDASVYQGSTTVEPGSVVVLRTLIRLDKHDVPRSPHENTVPPTRMDSDMQKH